MARYGQKFKERIVGRMLAPESADLERLSKEAGVTVETLERWRTEVQSRPRERTWSAAARLEAMIATASLDEAAKNAWCREQGIYPEELERWRESAMNSLAQQNKSRRSSSATRTNDPPGRSPKSGQGD